MPWWISWCAFRVDTAATALEKMSDSTDVKITDTTMTTVVEVAKTRAEIMVAVAW